MMKTRWKEAKGPLEGQPRIHYKWLEENVQFTLFMNGDGNLQEIIVFINKNNDDEHICLSQGSFSLFS